MVSCRNHCRNVIHEIQVKLQLPQKSSQLVIECIHLTNSFTLKLQQQQQFLILKLSKWLRGSERDQLRREFSSTVPSALLTHCFSFTARLLLDSVSQLSFTHVTVFIKEKENILINNNNNKIIIIYITIM